ncbi:MAG: aminopeptidase P family protein [Proteobacteria bacterium]|nr:aminopeptidase P family protein [Pseudomonadota bacterium]
MVSRRHLIAGGLAGAALAGLPRPVLAANAGSAAPMAAPPPITPAEHAARIARGQQLMQQAGISALLVESGSSLAYFTGIRWSRSERLTAALIPAEGQPVVVTPVFEEPSVRETLKIAAEVRAWNEDESPTARLAQAMVDRKATGRLAVEPTTRFFVIDRLRASLGSGTTLVSGEALVNACRQIKSPAELALLGHANAITLAALAEVHGAIRAGMGSAEIAALMDGATARRGGGGSFALVLLNEASAYPHGSHQRQVVREGSVVLMDCGTDVHGYESDISRTWIFGEPSARQRKVWATVKRGQELTLESARPGVPVGSIDDKVRRFYEAEGWGPAYRLPGLSHRTGHGIGMDGHESPYLVHGDATPLAPGMCFSNEPGIYIPGEFGIRLEDCWVMEDQGPRLFTPLSPSIDRPF